MNLTILIPALNEEKTIGQVIDSIPKKIEGIDQITTLVVDDGSNDNTSKIAKEKNATVIRHIKNKGLGKAFHSGLEFCIQNQIDILVTIDADNQFDAKEIPKLVQPLINHEADFVTGSRFVDPSYIPKNMPLIKQWGNKFIAKIISWATKKKINDCSCGFRAYGKEAILNLNLFGKFTYTQETLLDLAYKGLVIKEVPITVRYFDDRESRVAHSILGYGFKSGNIILRTVKDYRPLKFFGLSGLFIFGNGLILDGFVLNHYFRQGTFSPYKMIGFLGAFLVAVGIMIIFIGILADLIDKIRLTQEKILYNEKKKLHLNNTPTTTNNNERLHKTPYKDKINSLEIIEK
ncbi:glycosyltransferase family 2 protein [Patescibacteria group bacterium]